MRPPVGVILFVDNKHKGNVMFNIAVIGGGISGMASAYLLRETLEKAGIGHRFKLIEAEDTLGGKVKTYHDERFTCETGSNGFLDNKPLTLELVKKAGAEDMLLRSDDAAANRFIYSGRRLHLLSANPVKLFLDDLLTVPGRMRLLCEFFGSHRPEGIDETIAAFARRRVGKNAYEMLIDPMVGGIHAGNPEELSLKSCFPLMHEMETEYRSLTSALIQKQRDKSKQKAGGGPAGPGGVLTTFKKGLSSFVDVLADKLGRENIVSGCPVEKVVRVQGDGRAKYRVVFTDDKEPLEADVVVFASPAHATSKISRELDAEFSRAHSQIPYAKVNVVCLGFLKADFKPDTNGFGFLIPSKEQRKILGCLWTSSIFPGHRAPDGHVLLRVMIGGARRPDLADLPDDTQVEMAMNELKDIMRVDSEPDFIKVFRHEQAIPQYKTGHAEKMEIIKERLKKMPGVFTAGNAYKGVGFNDCIITANEAAAGIADYLK